MIRRFLFLGNFSTVTYRDLIWKKVQALILPLAFWNALAIIVVLLVLALFAQESQMLANFDRLDVKRIITSSILSIDDGSFQTSHAFLRDLFACFLISPLIVLSRPVFLVFLSHNLALGAIWGVWISVMGKEITAAYGLYPYVRRLPKPLRLCVLGK